MSTSFVKSGFWVDYNQSPINRYQILVTDWWAGILTNAIAVLITSAGGPLFILSAGLFNWLWGKISSRWSNVKAASFADARDIPEQLEIILEHLPRGGFANVPLGGPPVRIKRRRRNAVEVIGTCAMVLIVLGLPVLLITASIVSAGIATTTTAISNSPLCGKYVHKSPNPSIRLLEYDHETEAKANIYATDCYGTNPSSEKCNVFYSPNITYTVDSVSCPFKGDVCDTSMNGSIQLQTGLISGSILGINAKNSWFFSRTMTCSPLVTTDEYVGVGISKNGVEQWEYFYGSSDGAYTTVNPVSRSSWEIKGYSTSIHWSDPMASRSPFQPLPGFTAGPYPVTLNFISAHVVFYPNLRNDTIFPAQTQARFSDGYDGPDLYYNNSTRAGVLACVDQYQLCESIAGPCWDNRNITNLLDEQSANGNSEAQYVAWLLLIALKYSTAVGSTQFTGSEALDAQSKIAHMSSLPLAEQQWRVEAEKMFRTSLARIQLNLYDFARGTAAKYEGAYNTLPPEHRHMCSMIEIPTVGRKNINLIGLIGIVTAVAFVWVISRKRKDASGNGILVVLRMYNWLAGSAVHVWRSMLSPIMAVIWRKFVVLALDPLRKFLLDLV